MPALALVQQSVCQPVRDSPGDDLKLRLGEPRLPRQPIEEKKQDKILQADRVRLTQSRRGADACGVGATALWGKLPGSLAGQEKRLRRRKTLRQTLMEVRPGEAGFAGERRHPL